MLERPSRDHPRARPRRASYVRMSIAALALVLSFLLGIAFARTLDERPEDGKAVTSVRTLTPLPQEGPTPTVTVTVTGP